MRTVPSLVTAVTLGSVLLLLPVWWSRGAYAASSLATGYTAAALLLATLLISPVTMLRRHRAAPVHTPFRRSLGVHAGLLALIHMAISFPVHLGGDIRRFFLTADGGFLLTRFGLSNWMGLVANLLFVALLITSTDRSLRRLGAPTWKRFHRLALVAAGLTLLHTLGYQSVRQAWIGLTVLTLVTSAGLALTRHRARRAIETAPNRPRD